MLRTLCAAVAVLAVAVTARAADGDEVDLGGMKAKAPATWKAGRPIPPLQTATFTLPKADGDPEDAKVTVYFFQGQGGSVDQNIKRWQGMFKAPAGEKSKTDSFKVGEAKVTTVDVQGTYLDRFPPADPNAKVTEKPDFRLIGVVFENPKGPYFIRFVGPQKTVEKHKKDFDAWLKSFK
jgi:predicted RecA/RadA family phage recombinase